MNHIKLALRQLRLRPGMSFIVIGAEPKQLRALVLRQVGVMALVGLGLGLAAALALGRVAEPCCSACRGATRPS
jgi:hypothetical protein